MFQKGYGNIYITIEPVNHFPTRFFTDFGFGCHAEARFTQKQTYK